MRIIGYVRTDFPSKFGIPRQSGLVEAIKGKVVFEPEFHNPELFVVWTVFPISGFYGNFQSLIKRIGPLR